MQTIPSQKDTVEKDAIQPNASVDADRRAAGDVASILVVDDQPLLLTAIHRLLRGHVVHSATTVAQALDIMATTPVDIVLADCHMPGASGIAFLETVRQIRPQARRVLMSGDARLAVEDLLASTIVHHFVSKATQLKKLPNLVTQMLQRSEQGSQADTLKPNCPKRSAEQTAEHQIRP